MLPVADTSPRESCPRGALYPLCGSLVPPLLTSAKPEPQPRARIRVWPPAWPLLRPCLWRGSPVASAAAERRARSSDWLLLHTAALAESAHGSLLLEGFQASLPQGISFCHLLKGIEWDKWPQARIAHHPFWHAWMFLGAQSLRRTLKNSEALASAPKLQEVPQLCTVRKAPRQTWPPRRPAKPPGTTSSAVLNREVTRPTRTPGVGLFCFRKSEQPSQTKGRSTTASREGFPLQLSRPCGGS